MSIVFVLTVLSACADPDILTKKERMIQSKADNTVSTVLFDHDMSETASYNIRRDGSVAIKFEESVTEKKYTKVVNLLRSIPSLNGVYAEQSGAEVCGVP